MMAFPRADRTLLALFVCCCGIGCSSYSYLPENTGAICTDRYDNDGDGLIDCDDPECGPWCRICGDGVCHPEENVLDCPDDCAQNPVCGNGVCELGETMAGCSDCDPPLTCGNTVCEFNENGSNCPDDCGGLVCGNFICEPTENPENCPNDCGIGVACGDGACNQGETEETCPIDCGTGPVCGNGFCDPGEDVTSCSGDCGFSLFTCTDYCTLQSGCGYVGPGLVWDSMPTCITDCSGLNTVTCLSCFYTYPGRTQMCDADCDPVGCMNDCGTSVYCGG